MVERARYFVSGEGIEPAEHIVYTHDDGWMEEIETIRVIPSNHSYVLSTYKRTATGSHGTDWNEYTYEKRLDRESAIELMMTLNKRNGTRSDQRLEEHLKTVRSGIALERFEEACGWITFRCCDVINEHFFKCKEIGGIYHSPRTTVVHVQDASGSEWAVKISETTEGEIDNLQKFCAALDESGGCENILQIEPLGVIGSLNDGNVIAATKMPFLQSAYEPVYSDNKIIRFMEADKSVSAKEKSAGAKEAGTGIAKALAKIHELGFVHLDVRPENILINSEGQYVLSDIDGIRPLSDQYRGQLRCSTGFMAPELVAHKGFDKSTDVFAWGKSIWKIMAGSLPVHISMNREKDTITYPNISDDGGKYRNVPASSDEAKLIVAASRSMAYQNIDRCQDGIHLLNALTRVFEEEGQIWDWDDYGTSRKNIDQDISKIIQDYFPECQPIETLYLSSTATVIHTHNNDGTESAIKIYKTNEKEVQNLQKFCDAVDLADEWDHIIRIEKLQMIDRVGSDQLTAAIKMPYLTPPYEPFDLEFSTFRYKKADEKVDLKVLGVDIAKALSTMHKLGFIHLDVRPENFLMDSARHYVLADIDAVRPLTDQYHGSLRTAFPFMSPEISERKAIDFSADVFAWGRSIWYITKNMVTAGKTVTVGIHSDKEKDLITYIYPTETIREYNHTLASDMGKLIVAAAHAMAPQDTGRYKDGSELSGVLEALFEKDAGWKTNTLYIEILEPLSDNICMSTSYLTGAGR